MPRDRKWPSARCHRWGSLASDQLHCVHKPPPSPMFYIRVNKQKKSRGFQNRIWYINAAAPGNKPAKSNSSWAFLAHEK